ncbi:MAG: hypothetical protein AAFZ18_08915 [Myxococcota bacterium]
MGLIDRIADEVADRIGDQYRADESGETGGADPKAGNPQLKGLAALIGALREIAEYTDQKSEELAANVRAQADSDGMLTASAQTEINIDFENLTQLMEFGKNLMDVHKKMLKAQIDGQAKAML